ncbi:efflux RND transporter periplasmic adaptor subunit [Cytophagaceae bacterium YF14B1]|uniref:Efflux RND transporter periplasmic adaptor subunit n=1 Tax=Xanthocytophaga flava TaxID=3048013 RepID=A0AAE3U7H8_9BACT|nr:efflux RND transporter periplasmic adaptor subunit [Xanthocytophaga flavus]MDJ1482954.1 efflux RND transporter periplasmic adaptor subunit [Xanthocytophaga flavus]
MKKYIIFFLAVLTIAACQNQENAKETASEQAPADTNIVKLTTEQIKNAGIEVGTPKTTLVNGILQLQGTIDVPPQSAVSVSFPLGGYLRKTDLLPGMHVRKGQVLGVLEDMQFIQLQQDYLSAKEKFQLASTEYARQQELNVSKASSDKVFQQSKAELESQRINTRALAEKLELIGLNPSRLTADNISRTVNILSPINGFVTKVNVNIGKYTSPTDVLFELVNPEDIHLALNVFEKDINHLSVGQKVIAYNNENPDKKYEAEILLISKHLDQDRMATIHCHFKQFDATLLPGMFMNADVAVKNKTALTVHEDAVVRWQNSFYVFEEKEQNTFYMKRVVPGNTNGDLEQIDAPGITTATKLVTKNAYALLMKMKNSAEGED